MLPTIKKIGGASSTWDKTKYLRCVCISDTHTKHSMVDIPPGDVLIHAGDFTFGGGEEEVKSFSDWLGTLDFEHKLVIAGNHEVSFDLDREEFLKPIFFKKSEQTDFKEIKSLLKNCTYLEDSECEINGIKFYGTPHQPPYHDWGFNRNDEEREKIFGEIPADSDVVICHGPIYQVLDKCVTGKEAGCQILRKNILERIKPSLFVCGHIHESYGTENIEGVKIVNASICTFRYKPLNKPIIVDIPLKENI